MTSSAAIAASQVSPGRTCATAGPVDHAYLARFTLGNADLEREVLDLFAESAPTYLLQLMAAETDRGWYEAAHTIKGSARAVGAWEVALQAERAEAMRGLHNAAARSLVIEALAAAVDEVRAYIAGLASSA